METTVRNAFVTAGKLEKELKGYEKKYSDYNVVFWIPEGVEENQEVAFKGCDEKRGIIN